MPGRGCKNTRIPPCADTSFANGIDAGVNSSEAEAIAIVTHQLSTLSHQLLRLLNHFLQLSPEHSSVVAIKRDMEPIPFFALHDEF